MDEGDYLPAKEHDLRHCRTEGLDATMARHRLDAIVFPGADGSTIAARAGYPSIAVPLGWVESDGEAGLEPEGVMFTGLASSESRLIAIAHAFELITAGRQSPTLPEH